MRNLRTVGHRVGKAEADITAVCWDASRDEVLVTCGPFSPHHKIELLRLVQDISRPDYDPALPLYVVFTIDARSPILEQICVSPLLLTCRLDYARPSRRGMRLVQILTCPLTA